MRTSVCLLNRKSRLVRKKGRRPTRGQALKEGSDWTTMAKAQMRGQQELMLDPPEQMRRGGGGPRGQRAQQHVDRLRRYEDLNMSLM